jgi:hypothetical protein
LFARINGHSLGLGEFNSDTMERAQGLQTGLAFNSFESGGQITHPEIHLLVRRLAGHGLLEYQLGSSLKGHNQVVIEPVHGEFVNYAAIGIWNRPRQWYRQA